MSSERSPCVDCSVLHPISHMINRSCLACQMNNRGNPKIFDEIECKSCKIKFSDYNSFLNHNPERGLYCSAQIIADLFMENKKHKTQRDWLQRMIENLISSLGIDSSILTSSEQTNQVELNDESCKMKHLSYTLKQMQSIKKKYEEIVKQLDETKTELVYFKIKLSEKTNVIDTNTKELNLVNEQYNETQKMLTENVEKLRELEKFNKQIENDNKTYMDIIRLTIKTINDKQ